MYIYMYSNISVKPKVCFAAEPLRASEHICVYTYIYIYVIIHKYVCIYVYIYTYIHT